MQGYRLGIEAQHDYRKKGYSARVQSKQGTYIDKK